MANTPRKTTITIKPEIKGVTTGKTTFKGGVHKTRKDRVRHRRDKYARRDKDSQVNGE